MTLLWGLPFAGLLGSIALMPLLAPRFWHRHYGKVALAWALAFLLPYALYSGLHNAAERVAHTALLEYIPFVVILFALFTVAGGIVIHGDLGGTPARNTGLLALGTGLASVIGTTGASMVLIRPVLRSNVARTHRVHTVVFFIFLVSNIGGALSPLGDPPLFLGFLKGVDFFWPARALALPTLLLAGLLLALYYLFERVLYGRDARAGAIAGDLEARQPLRIEGKRNLPLLLLLVGVAFASGVWEPRMSWTVLGTRIDLENVVRDVLLVVLALISLFATPASVREHNGFSWHPIVEVAKLFAAIFVTMIPVLEMLRAGADGPLSGLIGLIHGDGAQAANARYFWLTGGLSAFLDNAPTYLAVFNLAGGDAVRLMGRSRDTLMAISCGAVYMGALTYIGNAPNFMVKAIAEDQGVAMPSFLGYLLYSVLILVPAFVALTLVFF